MTIRLACLDMAGTTITDDGTVEAAFVAAAETLGLGPGTAGFEPAMAYVRRTMGASKIEVFLTLASGDQQAATEANARFESAYLALAGRGGVAPLPGAEAAIDDLRSGGIQVCLTTGFSAPVQGALLDALGWRDRVDLALCPGPGIRGRPAPDMILVALMRLGLDAVDQVAVAGDTTSDLLAGTRAGAGIVAGVLTGAHDRATLEAAPHTHLLASVADLPGLAGVSRPGMPPARS